jgi:hypothetical protein
MKIYVGHSTDFDYQKNLYEPIKQSDLTKKHEFVFPHETSLDTQNKKEFYCTIDLMIAEVSYPSTGLGVELGWVEDLGKEIFCVHKSDSKPSGSIKSVSDDIRTYSNTEELIGLIHSKLSELEF